MNDPECGWANLLHEVESFESNGVTTIEKKDNNNNNNNKEMYESVRDQTVSQFVAYDSMMIES